jgi:hypothetical protein
MRMIYLPKVAKTNPNRLVEAKPLILSANTVRIKHFYAQMLYTARASHFFKADLKVVVPTPMPSIGPVPAVDFGPSRRAYASAFPKKFFPKNKI